MEKYDISNFAILLFKIGLVYAIAKAVVIVLLYYAKKQNIKWQKRWMSNVDVLLAPIAVCLFLLFLFFANPLWTSLLILILYIGFSSSITDYFLGINYKINQKLEIGTSIEQSGVQGIVAEFSPLGIWIKSNMGIQFVNYQRLHHIGYTVQNNNFIANHFNIKVGLPVDQKIRVQDLEAIIYGSPYLDGDRNANIKLLEDNIALIEINLRSDQYRDAFEAYLEESNYSIIKQ